MEALTTLFKANGFIPHGYCLTWDSTLLWLTAISDSVMTLSYATYLIGIAYFVWKLLYWLDAYIKAISALDYLAANYDYRAILNALNHAP